ncbi:hypothetical protein FTW19_12335 [Terriglobus albidus]|uniref:Uncharacterized protein n=1 Tax=Terriglobus albidus TaxID=1592106 RepID=A0A5B9E9C2_9BACT|nr:hypothetical protein [Terriglobus albidus]QEE28718.1 hypothetical protein FTW19_12335 [Terriglobus albidus]
MSEVNQRTHTYHAEATALSGSIIQPLKHKFYQQAYSKLSDHGGYLSQRSELFRVEEVLSYRAAYTQVGGQLDPKEGLGWSTLTTSVVEGLNILDVLTADRVVAQLSTVHPLTGYVPSISFLGTRFENLRIAGHKVELRLDLDLFGNKPAGDRPYIGDPGVDERISRQHKAIRECDNLPHAISARYMAQPVGEKGATSVYGSLSTEVGGSYPGRTFGHMIDIPNFGRIYLATFRLEHSDFEKGIPKKTLLNLKMIEVQMGCIASGDVDVSDSIVNGATVP